MRADQRTMSGAPMPVGPEVMVMPDTDSRAAQEVEVSLRVLRATMFAQRPDDHEAVTCRTPHDLTIVVLAGAAMVLLASARAMARMSTRAEAIGAVGKGICCSTGRGLRRTGACRCRSEMYEDDENDADQACPELFEQFEIAPLMPAV